MQLQVRYAACTAARAFMQALGPGAQAYDVRLLPRLCFTRHDIAEGVRRYSQETWRLLVGAEGRARLAACLPQVGIACWQAELIAAQWLPIVQLLVRAEGCARLAACLPRVGAVLAGWCCCGCVAATCAASVPPASRPVPAWLSS